MAALPGPLDDVHSVLTELLRLYDWRNEIGRIERDFNHDKKQVKTWLNRYGRQKKAAWEAARHVLAAVPSESADTLPCIVCDGTGRLKPLSPVTRALAERAVEAQRNDKRTIEEKIKDSVSFIMGPGGDEGTSAVAAPAEPDGYAVLLDDPNGATPGACGYWYVGAYRTEVVAKGVAERNKGARVVPMYFSPTAATRFSLCVECNELVTPMSRLCAREDCPQSKP